jgi:glycosyltransferase involved in cell wall biosynthesis
MKFVDVTYFHNPTTDPGSLLAAHAANVGYLEHLPADWEVWLIKFLNAEGRIQHGRTQFQYFQGSASGRWVPKAANRFIAQLAPGVVLFHSMIFPLKLLSLRRQLPQHTKLIVQHHAELPSRGIKSFFQRLAGQAIDAYIFSAKELADPWVNRGIVHPSKIFEVMEGSTGLQKIEKQRARQHLQLGADKVFLWVGRLNANKDPLTVLKGFEKYLSHTADAKLYMVFQHDELLPLVQQTINNSGLLCNAVSLVGKVDKSQMAYWYSAADVYLSGSHSEGSGYALIEAMSCGCIPVVTNIPSFCKITARGKAGLLFERGNADSLHEALLQLENRDLSTAAITQFEQELSFSAIARQMEAVCNALIR